MSVFFQIYLDEALDEQKFVVDTSNDANYVSCVVLAVDSNWNHDYSCLYNFRVHGTS